jgi:hypothetical protein
VKEGEENKKTLRRKKCIRQCVVKEGRIEKGKSLRRKKRIRKSSKDK